MCMSPKFHNTKKLNMNKKQQTANLILAIGMILLLVMAILPLFGIMQSWFKYIYAAGAVLTLIARFLDRYQGSNITLRRLYRIQTVSSICYCASAAILFSTINNLVSEKDWLPFLMTGAVLQIYSSLRIQSEERKEASKNKN